MIVPSLRTHTYTIPFWYKKSGRGGNISVSSYACMRIFVIVNWKFRCNGNFHHLEWAPRDYYVDNMCIYSFLIVILSGGYITGFQEESYKLNKILIKKIPVYQFIVIAEFHSKSFDAPPLLSSPSTPLLTPLPLCPQPRVASEWKQKFNITA